MLVKQLGLDVLFFSIGILFGVIICLYFDV